jgi:hypothetical protein
MYLPANLGMLSPILAGMMHLRGRMMEKQKKYNLCSKPLACKDCQSNAFCSAWGQFVELHSQEKFYAHFDKRVSLAMPSIRKYAMDNNKIATHSFYPFIHFTKTISRFGKKEPKKRELYYCSHLDRCVYQRYAFLLNQKYNELIKGTAIDDAAIAYRDNLGKNNIDFAKKAFDVIREKNRCIVIIGDFTEFFDRLDHSYLKKMLCNLLEVEKLPPDYFAIFKNITCFASWDWKLLVENSGHSLTTRGIRTKLNGQETILSKEQFQQNKAKIEKNKSLRGIPQGSPISAVLSNIYMLEFDKIISDYVLKYDGVYMRYSDDFAIVLPYKNEDDTHEHETHIFSQVDKIDGLDLQKEKTKVYVYDNGSITKFSSKSPSSIDYLGFVFDGTNIKLRPKAITKYYYRMHRKARTIGRNNWQSSKGKHIFAKKLYSIYASNDKYVSNDKKQTFIDYAKRAKNKLEIINDKETDAVINHHKRKIAHAIKSGQRITNDSPNP